MKYILLFVATLISFNSYSSKNAKDIYKEFSDKIIFIESKFGVGTGFELESGVFVTNRHVVFGYNIEAEKWNEPKKLILKNKKTIVNYKEMHCSIRVDLCVINTLSDNLKHSKVRLKDRKLYPGEESFVIGHPMGVSSPVISSGVVSSDLSLIPWGNIRNEVEKFVGFTTSSSISQGSSGSPLFSKNGELLGVVVGYLKESQNLNIVISAQEVNSFLDQIKSSNKNEIVSFKMGFSDDLDSGFNNTRENKTAPELSDNTRFDSSLKKDKAEKTIAGVRINTFTKESNRNSSQDEIAELTDLSAEVKESISKRMSTFQRCYQMELDTYKRESSINEKTLIIFSVGDDGRVRDISIESYKFISEDLSECLKRYVSYMIFSSRKGRKTLHVEQPVRFRLDTL